MRWLPFAAALACLSCGPDFDRSIALLAKDTILAVRAEPPSSCTANSVMNGAAANHADSVPRATSRRRKWASCASIAVPSRSMPRGPAVSGTGGSAGSRTAENSP